MKRRSNSLISNTQPVEQPVKTITFEQASKSFLLDCRAKNLAPRSIEFYEYGLNYLKKTFQKQGILLDIYSITARQIKDHFIGYMLDNKLASNTVNGRIKCCKAFFRYLNEEKIIAQNLADQFQLIIAEKKMIQTLTKDQMIQLLNQPNRDSFTGFRDYTIMMILLETGLRISECIALEMDDINLKEQEIRVKLGKGRKARRVPIQKTCIQVLKKYIVERGDAETNSLFVNIDHGSLKLRTIQENIQTYGKSALITGVRVSPHTFRHSMAKFYILNGGDIFTLQQILGHTTLEMVKYYVELFDTDIKNQHQKFSPVENMNLTKRAM
jgi:integrase/recombinase XerD